MSRRTWTSPASTRRRQPSGRSATRRSTAPNPARSGWRRAEIPAANGHGNARAVALIQSAIANGGEVAGVKLLSEAGCRKIFEEQSNGTDLCLDIPVRFGIGYGLTSAETPISPNANACYWGGWGGSVIVIDVDARLTFAYMMNRMERLLVGDTRGFALGIAVYQALGLM